MTVRSVLDEAAEAFSGRHGGLKLRIFEPKSALRVQLPVVLQLFKPGPVGQEETHGYTYDALMVSGGDPYPAAVFYVYEGAPKVPVAVSSDENLREVIMAALETKELLIVIRKISSEIP